MPTIKPGAYRVPLVAGLVAIGEDDLSKQVADKRIKLAVSNSIRGAVVSRIDLKQTFIDALNTEFAGNAADEGVIDYYIGKIIDRSIVPVENNSDGNSNKVYAPGELFFRS